MELIGVTFRPPEMYDSHNVVLALAINDTLHLHVLPRRQRLATADPSACQTATDRPLRFLLQRCLIVADRLCSIAPRLISWLEDGLSLLFNGTCKAVNGAA